MIIISHRGNLDGPNLLNENNPVYIVEALSKGFEVEVDVWGIRNSLFLGHDKPLYKIESSFLLNPLLWLHCKNLEAIKYFLCRQKLKVFFHQNDDYSIIDNEWVWTYPGKELMGKSIAVLPENVPQWDISKAYGICTDYPMKYKNYKKR